MSGSLEVKKVKRKKIEGCNCKAATKTGSWIHCQIGTPKRSVRHLTFPDLFATWRFRQQSPLPSHSVNYFVTSPKKELSISHSS